MKSGGNGGDKKKVSASENDRVSKSENGGDKKIVSTAVNGSTNANGLLDLLPPPELAKGKDQTVTMP